MQMGTIAKMPVTLKDRFEYGEELRIPATWDEFLDLVLRCDYRIEFVIFPGLNSN